MALTQATNRTATIEGRNVEDDFDYGPTDAMQAGSILITVEKLNTVGGEAARVGHQWECNIQLYDTIAGVSTGHAISDYTTTPLEAWDSVTRVVSTSLLTYQEDGDQTTNPGLGVMSLTTPATATAGMYQWRLTGTDITGNIETLMGGWVEIRAQYE